MQVDDYAEADRREVNPPIEVESATLSPGGTLDSWVRATAVVGARTRSRLASELG
jgi:hypothetical protein